MAGPMRTVSFKLTERLDDALTELARQRKSSRSALVREALGALAATGGLSVTAVAGDLAGSLDGPRDLSSSRKHMKNYGL